MKQTPENIFPVKRDSDFERKKEEDSEFKKRIEGLNVWKKDLEQKEPQFFKEIIEKKSDLVLEPKFLEEFLRSAKVYKTRNRVVDNMGKNQDGANKCSEDALLKAETSGYKLCSGYVYACDGRAFWHCFNVDPQGYVYDTYPLGNLVNATSVYMGVEHDIYIQQISRKIVFGGTKLAPEKRRALLDDGDDYIASLFKIEAKKDAILAVIEEYDAELEEVTKLFPLYFMISFSYNLRNLVVDKQQILDLFEKNEKWYEMMSRIALILSRVNEPEEINGSK